MVIPRGLPNEEPEAPSEARGPVAWQVAVSMALVLCTALICLTALIITTIVVLSF